MPTKLKSSQGNQVIHRRSTLSAFIYMHVNKLVSLGERYAALQHLDHAYLPYITLA